MKKTYILLASVFILLAFFTTTSAQITTTLKPGDKNEQVTLLQKILNAIGKSVSPSGPGSKGQETDEFGPSTASAVKAFQCERGIVCSGTPGTTGWGKVGPKTRAMLNSLGSSIAGFFSSIEGRSQLAGGIGDGTDSSLIYHNTFDGDSTPGKIGNARTFNGTSDYVDVPASAALNNISTGVAISAWVKFASPNTGTWQIIAAKLDKAGTNNYPYFQYMLGTGNGDNKPRFFVTLGNNVVESITSSKAVTLNEWHHIVGTYDKQYLKIYVDGVQRGSLAKSKNIINRDTPLRIGAQGAGAEFLKGSLDDLRIYNRGLTATEVSELYALGSGGTPTSVDGSCGTSNGGTFPSAPTTNLCSVGTASNVSPGPTFGWTCAGSNGGATVSCSATQSTATVVNGVCGVAATSYPAAATSFSGALCSAGTASPTSPSFPMQGASTSWICNGIGTGSTNSPTCTASRAAVIQTTATLTIIKAGTGTGTVSGGTISNCSSTCTQSNIVVGNSIALTASPAANTSVAWSGCTTSSGNTCNVTVNANTTVTATFTPNAVRVDGSCGAAAKSYTATESFPNGSLCSTGTASAVSPVGGPVGGGTASWTCQGSPVGTGTNQSCTASRAVVTQTNPSITSFTATPSSVTTGQTSLLKWSSTNATNGCTGTGFSTGGATSNTAGVSVSPTVTTTYTLNCAGASGTTPASQNVTVSVGAVGGPAALKEGNTGIAKDYPGDAGISGNANVLFADDFESTSPLIGGGRWDNTSYGNGTVDTSTAFSGSKSLKMTLPSGSGETSNAVVKTISPSQDKLHVRVYTKFDPNYHVTTDSNHNGIRISANYTGPGYAPNGHDFFMFLLQNTQPGISSELDSFYSNSLGDPGFYNVYSYYPEQRSGPLGAIADLRANPGQQWGDSWFSNGRIVPGDRTLGNFGSYFVPRDPINPSTIPTSQNGRPDGQWHSYEFMVQANTAGQRDGRVAYWIDGVLHGDFQNVYVRDAQGAAVKINKMMLELHAQGSPQINYKWYDNLVIAKDYIGPMVGGGTTSSPTATISASPSSITSGGSSTLTWSSTNATSCTASGGWSGSKSTSGSQSVSPTSNTTYSITCTGAGGTTPAQSATVNVGTVTNPPSTTFVVGDRVQVNNTSVQTRPAPGTNNTPVGSHTTGDLGTVLSTTDAGISANGYYWWKVNFDSGADGYVAEDFLTKVTTTGTVVLTVDRAGLGQGTVTSTSGHTLTCAGASCTVAVAPGTNVSVSATPFSSSDTFAGWTGCTSTSGNTCNITVNSNTIVTATFNTTGGGGTGGVTVNTCSEMINAVNAKVGNTNTPLNTKINVSSSVTLCDVGTLTVSGQSLIGPGGANGVGGTEIKGKIILQKSTSAVTRVEGFRFSQLGGQITVTGDPFARAYVLGKSYINTTGNNELITFNANGGLIHHNTFYTAPSSAGGPDQMQIKHVGESWSKPPTFGNQDTQGPYGGERNIYFEDNIFNNILETAPDGDDGARIVIRRNIYNDSSIVFHGGKDTDTSDYGTRQFEIYDNQFQRFNTTDNVSKWIWVRGGTGVIANNYIDDDTGVPYGLTSIKLGIGCPTGYPTRRQLGQAYDTVENPPSLPLLIFGNTGPGANDISITSNGTGGGGNNCGDIAGHVHIGDYTVGSTIKTGDLYYTNKWNWQPFTYLGSKVHPLQDITRN